MPIDASVLTAGLDMLGLALFGVAALSDLAFRIVPNRVPLGIASLGLAARLSTGTALPGLLGAVAVFGLAAFCWRRGWLGGADVKLFGAGALLVPPAGVGGFVLATCLAGGALAIVYYLVGRVVGPPTAARPAGRWRRLARMERRRLRRGGPLPYAIALTAGAGLVLAGS